MSPSSPQPEGETTPLLTLRAAFLLVTAVLCGAGAGMLLYYCDQAPAQACVTGVGVFAGAVLWLDRVVAAK